MKFIASCVSGTKSLGIVQLRIIFLSSFLCLVVVFLGILSVIVNASSQSMASCNNNGEICAPEIVKIITSYDNAEIFFYDCGDLCRELEVSYGLDPTSHPSQIRFAPTIVSGSDLLSYKITALEPNSTYYFRLRCVDDKRCGGFGPASEVSTSQCKLSFDTKLKKSQVITCKNILEDTQGFGVLGISESSKDTGIWMKIAVAVPLFSILAFGIYMARRKKCHTFKTRSRSICQSH